VLARAQGKGVQAVELPVSHAFHSPLVAAAAAPLAEQLGREPLQRLKRNIVSTVTGAALAADEDLRAVLVRQVTAAVQFAKAVTAASDGVDLWIEAGPGQILSGLVRECVSTPSMALDAGGSSLKGLLSALGAAFTLGADFNHELLFAGRFTRPFDLDWRPKFL